MISRRSVVAGLAVQGALSVVPTWGRARQAVGPVDFRPLATQLSGDVLTPISAGYERARRTFSFNPRNDRHPAAIAQCLNADDIARSLEFARKHALVFAVRSGGHDALAASTCDNGLVIDLRRMNSIRRGESGKSVIVGPGAHAGAILEALAPYGQAIPVGDYEHVGIAGLALGGGLGALIGSLGATCDHLQRARIITADGKQLIASKDENAELFWALRGGGGNFGIVTEFEIATHQVPTAIGGMMIFEATRLGDFLRFYADYMARAPRELAVELRLLATDRPLIMLVACFVGDAAAAERALAPLRAWSPLVADGIHAAPFIAARAPTPAVIGALSGGDRSIPQWDQGAGFHWAGGSIVGVSDGAIKAVVDSVERAPNCGWGVSLGHHMHGAVCEVGVDTSPLPRPQNQISYHFDAWWGEAAQIKAGLEWVDASQAAMVPYAAPAYVNYLCTDDPASIAAAYGPSFARLRTLKRRYDPDNVFRRNRNIPPA